MAKTKLAGFDDVKGKIGFDLIPQGTYIVELAEVKIEEKPKERTSYNFTLIIKGSPDDDFDDSLQGRKYVEFVLLASEDEDWRHIPLAKIKAIAEAFAGKKLKGGVDFEALYGQTMLANIKVKPGGKKPGGGKYEDSNEIKSVAAFGVDDDEDDDED
jgi:hypothetical protein